MRACDWCGDPAGFIEDEEDGGQTHCWGCVRDNVGTAEFYVREAKEKGPGCYSPSLEEAEARVRYWTRIAASAPGLSVAK